MPNRIRVFLDTSALFAGIWSSAGGGRMILKLGESGLIQLLVSSQVLKEIEDALRRKAPDKLGMLTILLDRSNLDLCVNPSREILDACLELVNHPGDVLVVAAVWSANVNFFVTLDRAHFLDNKDLHDALSFPLGTPGDFIAWYRSYLTGD